VLALAGSIADDGAVNTLFDGVLAIIDGPSSLEVAMEHGAANLERAAGRLARILIVGKRL
jgi:glycerate kinase